MFGIEYEGPSASVEAPRGVHGDRPAWGWESNGVGVEGSGRKRKQYEEVRLAKEELTRRYSGGESRGSGESEYRSFYPPLSNLVTMRYAVTIVNDSARDCVYEISVGAPADAWDDLWEGSEEETSGGGGMARKGWPSSTEIGLRGFGLKGVMENATISSSPRNLL